MRDEKKGVVSEFAYYHESASAISPDAASSPELTSSAVLPLPLASRAGVLKRSSRSSHRPRWKAPRLMQCMNFVEIPILTKLSFAALLLSIVSLTTPNWVSLTYNGVETHFGLWHYCDSACEYVASKAFVTSDLPAWYMYARLCYTIAVLCSLAAMLVVRNHTHYAINGAAAQTSGKQVIRWSRVMRRATLCLVAISALQQVMTITVFSVQGMQPANHPLSHLTKAVNHDFRLSYYCAWAALATTSGQIVALFNYSPPKQHRK